MRVAALQIGPSPHDDEGVQQSSWNKEGETSEAEGNERENLFRSELSAVFDTAVVSFDSIRDGRVSTHGETAALVRNCLVKMLSLLDYPKRAGLAPSIR
jgi:hypothetical protein